MNKRILHISLFLMLASTANVFAQQGIGTHTPHRSAALQIESQNKGLLIPRVNITDENSSNPISGNVPEGLMVYNKGEGNGTIAKGFYYWANNKWNSFLTSLNSSSTDDQVIEKFEITPDHILNIQIEGDSNTHQVDLAPYVNKSYAISSLGNEMILSVDDVNITPAASIISNNTLSIENGTNNTKNLQSSVNGEVSSIDITNLIRTEQITYSLEDGTNTTAELVSNTANAKSYKVNVPTATTSNLGVIRIGSGFEATTDGTLNVAFPDQVADVNTSFSDLQTSGKLIGIYTNEANTSFNIKETVTSLSYENNQLVYTNENGTQAPITIVGEDTKSSVVNSNTTTVDGPLVVAGVNEYKVEMKPLIGDVVTTIPSNVSDQNISSTVTGIQNVEVVDTPVTNGQVLSGVVDGNEIKWKAVNASMPKFFYMPSLVIPLDPPPAQNPEPEYSYTNYNSNTQTFSINLYNLYVLRFTNPQVSNPNAEPVDNPFLGVSVSNPSTALLPIVPENLLDYHITYYDTTVLSNVTLSNDGVLSYKVINDSEVTEATFMNIVFKVRNTTK